MSTVALNASAPTQLTLSGQQTQALNRVAAEFSTEQLIWSSGYFAGLAAQQFDHHSTASAQAEQIPQSSASVAPLGGALPSTQLTVLYGSQTGNGRALAEQLHQHATTAGLSVELLDMVDFNPREIAKLHRVAIVVSTHGEGDAPDDAEMLLEYLQSDRAPKLPNLSYSVLALGDSSYEQFCQTGRDFDQQLEHLGAQRFGERVECDLDYQSLASAWSEHTIEAAQEAQDNAGSVPIPATMPTDVPPGNSPVTLQVVGSPVAYSEDKPFVADVLLNQKITGDRSSKTVQHLELDLQSSGLHYEPGDGLGVITNNPPLLVEEFLEALGVSGDLPVRLQGTSISLQEALESRLEITANSGAFLSRYAELVDHQELNAWLDHSDHKRTLLNDYQIVDVLKQWPFPNAEDGTPTEADIQAFIDACRTLTPRVYSIASSELSTPEEVHITVAEVAYEKFGRPHWGSASTALTHALSAGDKIGVFVEQNKRFRLPQNSEIDVIMIGPGTGVAPFRAFVEHRVATQASGRNWLFFGDRNFDEDFLYQTEWQKHIKRGNLHQLDVAFSRDQAEKVYVQDKLIQRGEEIFAWLEQGAHIYVCGDATAMAPDVHQALIDLIAKHGQQSPEQAADYLKQLKREQRYLRDVY